MIRSLSDLHRYIEADARSRRVSISLYSFFADPITRFTIYLRVNEYISNKQWPIWLAVLPKLVFKKISIRLGFSIPINVFGAGLAIVHYGTIVVHPDCRVGENARVHVGVNIGSNGQILRNGRYCETVPIIGKNCHIAPGAKLFGDIVIGDDCIIGANAVVNRSFPEPYLTIAGVPARVVKRRSANESGGLDAH